MTGSFLVLIITPIVAIIALAFWLGMVYWADAHPGWKAHATAPGPEITGVSPPAAAEPGEHHGGELAPSPDRKAA
jgi:hypothetical protein